MSTASLFFLLASLANPSTTTPSLALLPFSFACINREAVNSLVVLESWSTLLRWFWLVSFCDFHITPMTTFIYCFTTMCHAFHAKVLSETANKKKQLLLCFSVFVENYLVYFKILVQMQIPYCLSCLLIYIQQLLLDQCSMSLSWAFHQWNPYCVCL